MGLLSILQGNFTCSKTLEKCLKSWLKGYFWEQCLIIGFWVFAPLCTGYLKRTRLRANFQFIFGSKNAQERTLILLEMLWNMKKFLNFQPHCAELVTHLWFSFCLQCNVKQRRLKDDYLSQLKNMSNLGIPESRVPTVQSSSGLSKTAHKDAQRGRQKNELWKMINEVHFLVCA